MRRPGAAQRGATLIEVMVSLVIIAFGLLGLAGLQIRMQVSEIESYQRSQALLLLNDMANRMAANRSNAASYVTTTGTGATCAGSATTAQLDVKEWCEALQGTNVTAGGSNKGGIISARGCVQQLSAGEYMVTVAWQSMVAISAPPSSVTCGLNAYNGAQCTADRCRRVVTTLVRIASLT